MEEYVRQVNTNIELSQEIERLNKELEFERQIKKEAREYIKSIPDDEFLESEHFTELIFILGKVEGNK